MAKDVGSSAVQPKTLPPRHRSLTVRSVPGSCGMSDTLGAGTPPRRLVRMGLTCRFRAFRTPLGGQTAGWHGTVPEVRLRRTPDAPAVHASCADAGDPHRGMKPAACRALAPATAHTRGTS